VRPLLLKIQAFGPFAGTQALDFRELGDRSLFLIHGPTGAGKTTILDALSFALFGESSGAERDGKQLRSDFADENLPTEVSLDFQHGEKSYRITRRPEQMLAKKRGNGTTRKSPEATFLELAENGADNNTVKATKTTDCTKAVVELLGLDANQFRQVILIPQGQFRQFLLASTDEREKIFQSLFRTSRYRAIQDRLKSQAKDIRERRDRNRTQHEVLLRQSDSENVAALDEHLAELDQQFKKLRTRQKAATEKLKAATDQRTRFDRLLETFDRQVENQTQLATATKALGEAESAAKKTATDLAAEEKRQPEVKQWREQFTLLQKLVPQLKKYQATVSKAAAANKQLGALQKAIGDRTRIIEEQQALAKTLSEQIETLRSTAAEAEACRLKRDQAKKLLDQRLQIDKVQAAYRKAQSKTEATEAEGKKLGAAVTVAKKTLSDLLHQRHQGRAASLAADLQPDSPCPVCGATDHPAPASSDADIPDEDAIEAAEKSITAAEQQVDRARDRYRADRDQSTQLKTQLESLRDHLGEARNADPAELRHQLAAAEKASTTATEAAAKLKLSEKQQRETSDSIDKLQREQKRAEEQISEQRSVLDRATARRDELAEQIDENLRPPGRLQGELDALDLKISTAEKTLTALREAKGSADENAASARTRCDELNKTAAAFEEELRTQRTAFSEQLQDIAPTDETPLSRELLNPIRDQLVGVEAEASREADLLNTEAGELGGQLKTCRSQRKQIAELDKEHAALEAEYRVSGQLADVANGDNPHRVTFQRFVLGALLDEVLSSASHRLHAMSRGRYQMYRSRESRRGGGLDLEVMDHFSGVARPVATLSGGESFLASLSLALGIADVTESHAGGVRMETMFIDEGFGTLDGEALDLAFNTLYELQEGGRLVGVISHVTELRERIDTRLEVLPKDRGSVARFVV
jgi:exonuclease SbcC